MSDMLEYKRCLGSVEYSRADEVFFGHILGIRDHITYDGVSVQGLKKSFEEAVDDYIEACLEIGKEPEKSYGGCLNLRINPDLHKKLVYFSNVRMQSLDKSIEEAIDKYMVLS